MIKQYQVSLWNEVLARQGLACQSTAMMSVQDMLNTNPDEITFTDITVGEYLIDASHVGTDHLTVVAKYLVHPYENNQLKHPLGAYLCALSDDLFSNELPPENADQDAVFNPEKTSFDIRTVKDWVENYLIGYSEESADSLFKQALEGRVNKTVEEIKNRISPEMAEFVRGAININQLIHVYEHHDDFHEFQLKAKIDGTECKALFKLSSTSEDEYFKQFDKFITA